MVTYPMNQTANKKVFFPALTGLRAFTAYLVCIQHYNLFTPSSFAPNPFFRSFFSSLEFTMTIFFVLSGFVITHRYMNNVPFSASSFKKYIIDRGARICPVYFIVTICTFIYYFLFKRSTEFNVSPFIVLFANLTFTKTFFNDLKYTLVGQGWTLTIEWCFYLCAPMIIPLVKRSYKYIFIISAFLLLIGFLLVEFAQYAHLSYGFFENNEFMLLRTFFGRCFDFLCGMGLAIFLRRTNNHKKSIIWRTSFSWLVILLFVFFASTFLLYQHIPLTLAYLYFVLHSTLLPICVTLLLYGLIIEKTLFSRFLSSKLMVLLGSSSYAFYLLHKGVLSNFLVKKTIIQNNLVLHFIIMNILAIIVYKYIEKPLYSKVKKMGEKIFLRKKLASIYTSHQSLQEV